jgi:hypothetical protein
MDSFSLNHSASHHSREAQAAAQEGHFLHFDPEQNVEGIAYCQDGANGHIEQDIRQQRVHLQPKPHGRSGF